MRRRSKTGGGPGTNQWGIRGSARNLFHRRAGLGTRRSIEEAIISTSSASPDGIDAVELPRPERVGWSTRKRRQLSRWLTIRRGGRDPYLPPAHHPTASMATTGPSATAGGAGGGGPRILAPPAAGGDRPDEVAAMLTQHFADVEYTDDEMKAVNAYCRGKDRNDEWFYRRVNRYIRGQGSHHDAEAAAIGDRIDDALAREVTPQRIVAFRGLKNLDALGVDHSNVVHLTGRVVVLTGYQSTTIDPAVAIEDFAGPPGQGAVLRIEVPVGTEAIWVPTFNPVGKFSDQRELLLDTGHAVTVRSVSQETGTLWVTCEILT